jgi:hypothetical protein
MRGDVWIDKYSNNPLIKQFYELFGGQFLITPQGNTLRYNDKNNKPHKLPDSESEFVHLIKQSIEQGKNLLIQGDAG